MNDEQSLEQITADFTKSLIHNKMHDMRSYLELAKRLANLIDAEMKWRLSKEEEQAMMNVWPPFLKN